MWTSVRHNDSEEAVQPENMLQKDHSGLDGEEMV